MSTLNYNIASNGKYSTGQTYIELRRPHKHTVAFTPHAAQRWDERTPEWSMAPEKAIQKALPLTDFKKHALRSPNGIKPQMAYYFAEWFDEHHIVDSEPSDWFQRLNAQTDRDLEVVFTEPDELSYDVVFMERHDQIKTVYKTDFMNNRVQGYCREMKEKFKNGV